MSTKTPDITKLPKWAQEHIADLVRERDRATERLEQFKDTQTPSAFFFQEDLGKQTRYVQTDRISIAHGGSRYEVSIHDESRLKVWCNSGSLAVMPHCGNVVVIGTDEQVKYPKRPVLRTACPQPML